MKSRPLTHSNLEHIDTIHRLQARCAVAVAVQHFAPRVVEALRDQVLAPYGSVLLRAVGYPYSDDRGTRDALTRDATRHALTLAGSVFSKVGSDRLAEEFNHPLFGPGYGLPWSSRIDWCLTRRDPACMGEIKKAQPWAEVDDYLSGSSGFDPIANEIVEDAMQADIAAHSARTSEPHPYPAQCRFLGEPRHPHWSMSLLSALDESRDEWKPVVAARNALAAFANRFNLRVCPNDDGWLCREWFCEILLVSVLVWERNGYDGRLDRFSIFNHLPRLPNCNCPSLLPSAPAWSRECHYAHGFLDCRRLPPRPSQRHADLRIPDRPLDDFPRYDPYPVDYTLKYGHYYDRDHQSASASDWFDRYFANVPYGKRAAVKQRYLNEDSQDCDEIDQWYYCLGFRPVERQPSFDLSLCAEWWVRYQVGADDHDDGARQSFDSIANVKNDQGERDSTREAHDPRSVSHAVKYLCDQTGICEAPDLERVPTRKRSKAIQVKH